jgi:hypothetical protein
MHPLSNTRAGMIQIAAAAANLGEGLLALIDTAGKAALATPSTAAARFIVVDSDANYATLCPLEAGRQVRVKLAGACNPGDGLTVNADSKAAAAGADDPIYLIAEEAGIDGQDILCRAPAEIPAPPADELPAIASGDAGKVLRVKEDESGVEFGTPVAELPTPVEGDAGKVLTVNAEEDGVEWTTPAAGASVPTPTTGDAKKLLRVNPTEDGYDLAGTYLDDAVLVLNGAAGGIVFGPVGSAPRMDNNGGDLLIVQNIPTTDPGVSGALWNDSGTLKLSAGM